MKKRGRPAGSTKSRTIIKRAAQLSILNISQLALSGDLEAQKLIMQAIAANPDLLSMAA